MKEREVEMNNHSTLVTRKRQKKLNYIQLEDKIGGLSIKSDLSKVCNNIFEYSNVQQDVVDHIFKYIIGSEDEKLNKSIDCELKINEYYNFNEDLKYFNKSKDKFEPSDEELIIIKNKQKSMKEKHRIEKIRNINLVGIEDLLVGIKESFYETIEFKYYIDEAERVYMCENLMEKKIYIEEDTLPKFIIFQLNRFTSTEKNFTSY